MLHAIRLTRRWLVLALLFTGLTANSVRATESLVTDQVPVTNWIDPQAIERLKAVAKRGIQDSVILKPLWQVDEASATELSDQERGEVLNGLENLIKERLNQQGAPTLQLEIIVREVWRPSRLLNFLMFVLPIPGSGPLLSTRGGIAIETSLLDLQSGAVVARFGCRKRGDLSSLLGIFGRAEDTHAALQYCTERLLDALVAGQMPSEVPRPTNPDGTFSGG
jgi:hypothetical protein